MPAEPATTILEALLRLFRRREEGKDRRRDLTEEEREWVPGHVPKGVERQGAGIGDSHFVFDADGTPYCDNLDWQYALGWFAFTGPPSEFGEIIGLIRRVDALDWRALGFGLADLETLNQRELSAIGLNPTDIEILAFLFDLQSEGRFELFRQYLLEGGPHFKEIVGAVSDDRDDEGPLALTAIQSLVIVTMDQFDVRLLLSAEKIGKKMELAKRLSEETIRKTVAKLIKLELAERPQGPRSGARLTMKGRKLAGKIAD